MPSKKDIQAVAEFITERQAAAAIPLPPSTFRVYMTRGLIPSYKLGKHRLFRRTEVIQAVLSTRQGTVQEVVN